MVKKYTVFRPTASKMLAAEASCVTIIFFFESTTLPIWRRKEKGVSWLLINVQKNWHTGLNRQSYGLREVRFLLLYILYISNMWNRYKIVSLQVLCTWVLDKVVSILWKKRYDDKIETMLQSKSFDFGYTNLIINKLLKQKWKKF